jgi:hypothetical protein
MNYFGEWEQGERSRHQQELTGTLADRLIRPQPAEPGNAEAQ